mgnify:CR=1 FL=1
MSTASAPALPARTTRRSAAPRLIPLALALLVLVLFFVRVLLGDYTVTFPDLVRILGGEQIPGASYIVREAKLPRALAAVLVGGGLGLAGALMQDLLRNPLASPDVLGISIGASAGAVVGSIVLGLGGYAVSLAALGGALGVALLVVLLARGSTTRMVLVGVACASVLSAVIQWLLTRSDLNRAQAALAWLIGSLGDVTMRQVAMLAVALAILTPLAAMIVPDLRAMRLGDDTAAGLGVPVRRRRAMVLLLVVLVVAACASVAGPVVFVSLLAGPIARALSGRPAPFLAAGVGAALLLAADFVAAELAPSPLPVGVVTGLAGGPFLLWLVLAPHRKELR